MSILIKANSKNQYKVSILYFQSIYDLFSNTDFITENKLSYEGRLF